MPPGRSLDDHDEKGKEFSMANRIEAERESGLHYEGRTKQRAVQSKRARAGLPLLISQSRVSSFFFGGDASATLWYTLTLLVSI